MKEMNVAQQVLLNIGGTAAGCAFGFNRDNPEVELTNRQKVKLLQKKLGMYTLPKAFRQYRSQYQPSLRVMFPR